jgi:hypothetical protein
MSNELPKRQAKARKNGPEGGKRRRRSVPSTNAHDEDDDVLALEGIEVRSLTGEGGFVEVGRGDGAGDCRSTQQEPSFDQKNRRKEFSYTSHLLLAEPHHGAYIFEEP